MPEHIMDAVTRYLAVELPGIELRRDSRTNTIQMGNTYQVVQNLDLPGLVTLADGHSADMAQQIVESFRQRVIADLGLQKVIDQARADGEREGRITGAAIGRREGREQGRTELLREIGQALGSAGLAALSGEDDF